MSRRIAELRERLALGWASLTRALMPTERALLDEILDSQLGRSRVESFDMTELSGVARVLAPIQRAEFLLGATARKTSRLSMGVGDAEGFEALIRSGIPFVLSRQAYRSKPDVDACGFANTFESAGDIRSADDSSEVLCYVNQDIGDARAAAELDSSGAAGDYFGIPRCCQAHFSANWESARQRGGDLFASLVLPLASEHAVALPWQCNAAAMYFGGGLCWHFPCSVDCPETIAMVDRRAQELEALDTNLARHLIEVQRRPFFLSTDGRYGTKPDQTGLAQVRVAPT